MKLPLLSAVPRSGPPAWCWRGGRSVILSCSMSSVLSPRGLGAVSAPGTVIGRPPGESPNIASGPGRHQWTCEQWLTHQRRYNQTFYSLNIKYQPYFVHEPCKYFLDRKIFKIFLSDARRRHVTELRRTFDTQPL